MSTPPYFTDAKLAQLRSGLIAMGAMEHASFEILDGYEHMRAALYQIERLVDAMNRPRLMTGQLVDETVLAMSDTHLPYATLLDDLESRFKKTLDPLLADVREVARLGAEMGDWVGYLEGETTTMEQQVDEVLDGREKLEAERDALREVYEDTEDQITALEQELTIAKDERRALQDVIQQALDNGGLPAPAYAMFCKVQGGP